MFKKLLVVSAVLAASSGIAFAGHSYKGERDYKGEMPSAPSCPTNIFTAGPYIGLSAGLRTNYTGTPTVYKGFEGTLSAGYAAMMNPTFYLAGEVFVGDSANIKNFTQESNSANGVRSTWNYGLSIIPGFMITDNVMGYVRAGVVRTRFSDMGTSATGGQLGLGMQTNLTQNWDLRGEYVYSQYRAISGIGKPQSDQFNLGLIYKFM